MDGISLFDCNCMFGKHAFFPRFGEINNAQELLSKMDYYGIEKALVSYCLASAQSAELGNQMMVDEIRGQERLFGVWSVLSPKRGVKEITKKNLEKNNIRAVRISRVTTLSDWIYGDLFKTLNRLRLPIIMHLVYKAVEGLTGYLDRFYEYLSPGYWDRVCEISRKYPDMPIILSRMRDSYRNMIHEVLGQKLNIFFELSNYHTLHAIEGIVSNYGSEKLLFGTWMPFQDPGQTIALITYADVSLKDKEMIASKNLEKLMENVKVE